MAIIQEISECLQKGKVKQIKALVQQALDQGEDPRAILNEGLLEGMSVIGGRFKREEIFVPDVLISARTMSMGLSVLEPKLVEVGNQAIGKIVLGTVKGDLHDIGKNLVAMMFKGAGFEVIDLGVDVEAEAYLEKAEEVGADIIGMSALLSTTMPAMKELMELLEEKGLRDKYIVMIGGAPITDEFAKEIGADYYTPDAASAAEIGKKCVLEKSVGYV